MARAYDVADWSSLPVPEDDGATDHLRGMVLPSVSLASTGGGTVDLAALPGLTIVYIYPKTGQPGTDMPDGWDMIPGARGCTPQTCSFRDHMADLTALGVDQLFGLSSQDTAYQAELKERSHLPFDILSDAGFALTDTLSLPTFDAAGERLIKRMSVAIRDGKIVDVIYPIFPPDQNASMVMEWLRSEREA